MLASVVSPELVSLDIYGIRGFPANLRMDPGCGPLHVLSTGLLGWVNVYVRMQVCGNHCNPNTYVLSPRL